MAKNAWRSSSWIFEAGIAGVVQYVLELKQKVRTDYTKHH